jgi:hypothetical protein
LGRGLGEAIDDVEKALAVGLAILVEHFENLGDERRVAAGFAFEEGPLFIVAEFARGFKE